MIEAVSTDRPSGSAAAFGPIVRRVLTVAGGTAVGQAVLVGASPLLTRLFTPAEFGTLAAYMALVAVFGVIATMRYHVAIVLADEEDRAVAAIALSLLAVGTTTLVNGIVIIGLGTSIAGWFAAPELQSAMWIVAVGTGALGLQQVLSAWMSRTSNYRPLGLAKAAEGCAKASSQLGLGVLAFGSVGLLLGDVVGRIAGAWLLAGAASRQLASRLVRVRRAALVDVARRYRDFPLFSTPGVLMNTAGLQAPALLFASFYGLEVAGAFALGQRVIAMPMALVGQAASQVHLGEASRLARDNPRALQLLFARATRHLAVLGGLPILAVAVLGPWVFGIVFGAAWVEAGMYVRIFAIAFALQFVVAPLSSTLNVLEHQRLQMAWDGGRLIAVVGAIVGSAALGWDARGAMAAYAVAASVAYVVVHALGWFAICRRVQEHESHA